MSGDERVKELLGRLRGDTPALHEDELRSAARSAAREPRALARSTTRGATLGRRAALAAVAVALLVGSGLGFGLGSSVTPTGSAGTNVVGFGFLAAKGWTIVQAELVAPGTARAVATNVDLHPDDRVGAVPRATIESLPSHGVVIVATFRPRGDPERALRSAPRDLPLSLSDAERVGEREYRLEATVGAYHVETEIHLGAGQELVAAQGQLSRLVVASERVTIFARPNPIQDWRGTTLYGSVESRRAGESVTIQARDCGQSAFRVVTGATTTEGGGWTTPFGPSISTTVRAVWGDSASSPITIRQKAIVQIQRRAGGRLTVWVTGRTSFWRKRLRIERFDARLGRWRVARSLLLTDTSVSPGRFASSSSSGSYRPNLPKGTLVRAVLPLAEARPCYLAGTSRAVRL